MYARIAVPTKTLTKRVKHHMEEAEELGEDAGDSLPTNRVFLYILLLFLQTHIIILHNVTGKKSFDLV